MLWKAELKKILIVRRGLLILLACLILKSVFLFVFPEQKDPRIALSQHQYDKFLNEIYGESSDEKNARIMEEYEWCKSVIDQKDSMAAAYADGTLLEEDYQSYLADLETAYLEENAAKIFSEKAEQFMEQDPALPRAHYIYEYGWQTVFTLQQFPDVFLLLGLLLLAAQCFASEATAGMLPVLLAARNGKTRLYCVKFASVLLVSLFSGIVFALAEAGVFAARGWCSDAAAPLHSVSVLTKCALGISLLQGYLLSLAVRVFSSMLLAAVVYALSIWVKNPIQTVFLGMCLVILPLLMNGSAILFTHGGLLCGTRTLQLLGKGLPAAVPPLIVAVYSAPVVFFAARRYRKGL